MALRGPLGPRVLLVQLALLGLRDLKDRAGLSDRSETPELQASRGLWGQMVSGGDPVYREQPEQAEISDRRARLEA